MDVYRHAYYQLTNVPTTFVQFPSAQNFSNACIGWWFLCLCLSKTGQLLQHIILEWLLQVSILNETGRETCPRPYQVTNCIICSILAYACILNGHPHTLSVWCEVWKALCSTTQKIDEKIWNIEWPLGFTPNCTERLMIKKLFKHSYVQVQNRSNLTNRRAPTNRKL